MDEKISEWVVWLNSSGDATLRAIAGALSAQAQEIERLKINWTFGHEIKQLHEQIAHLKQRAEAAEARVRELERSIALGGYQFVEMRAERDAIEAKTIERCAQVAESTILAAMSPEVKRPMTAREIAGAIRDLAKTT